MFSSISKKISEIWQAAPQEEKTESKSYTHDYLGSSTSAANAEKIPNSGIRKKSNAYYHLEKNEDEFHHSKLGLHAFLLWKNNKVTDVTIQFKDKSYAAHKPVLSCYSTHFKERILCDDANKDVIVMDAPSITTDAFETLLYYMYTGHLELTCQNIGDVYTASRKLGIKTALTQCIDTFVGKTKPEVQPVYLYATAKKLNETVTAQKSLITMARHFEQIVGTKEFLDLNFEEVTEYLACDELAVRSEVVVYLAALKWLNTKFFEREIYIEDIIKCVRFSAMTLNEILACHSPPLLPGIVEMPAVQYLLLKATCYVSAKSVNEQKRFEKYACTPRTYLIKKVPLILWDPNIFVPERYAQYKKEMAATIIQAGFRGYLARKEVEKFKDICKTYSSLRCHSSVRAQLGYPTSQSEGSNASVLSSPSRAQKGIVGSEAESNEDGVSAFSKVSLPPESGHRDYSILSIENSQKVEYSGDNAMHKCDQDLQIGMIVVLGGCDPSDPSNDLISNSMMYYNPALDNWSEFGTMPINRHHHCAVLYHKAIYIIGGCNFKSTMVINMVPSNTCFKLELNSMAWSQIADLNHCRVFHNVAVVQDKIFVVGGFNEKDKILDSIECYTIKENKWDLLTVRMSCPKMSVGVCAHNDQLWLAGGMTEDEGGNLCIIKEVERYCPAKNRMLHKVTDLPGPRSYVTLVECDGSVYTIGGEAFLSIKDKKLSSLAEVNFYDDETNLWISSTPLPNPQHAVAAVVFGGAIYVLGGMTTYFPDTASPEVIVYESSKDIWAKCESLPVAREATCAVTVPCSFSKEKLLLP